MKRVSPDVLIVPKPVTCMLASAQTPSASPAAEVTYKPLPGLDRSIMDTTADPCVDFNQYACGNFSKLPSIPSDLPFRTKGVLVNMPEFGKAFGCKSGQPIMPQPAGICRVW